MGVIETSPLKWRENQSRGTDSGHVPCAKPDNIENKKHFATQISSGSACLIEAPPSPSFSVTGRMLLRIKKHIVGVATVSRRCRVGPTSRWSQGRCFLSQGRPISRASWISDLRGSGLLFLRGPTAGIKSTYCTCPSQIMPIKPEAKPVPYAK